MITSVANELCNHVLVPLLKLHPSQVRYRAHLERQPDDGSYTVEVSYGRAKTLTEEEDHSSVEAATLQCLQAVKRKQSQALPYWWFAAAWPGRVDALGP